MNVMTVDKLRELFLPGKKPYSSHSQPKQHKRVCQVGRLGFLFRVFFIFSLELLDSSSAVEEFLFPRIKWMTTGADFYAHLFLRIERFVSRATRAGYGRFVEFRMNALFHNTLLYHRIQ